MDSNIDHTEQIKVFDKTVSTKFNIYNSLFLNLPPGQITQVGMLMPLLHEQAKSGFEAGQDPMEILEAFFEIHTEIESEEDRIEFMFNVIRYVERQIVLFDSVEDAAFSQLESRGSELKLTDLFRILSTDQDCTEITELLGSFSARLVLTAHPTQFYPQAVLDIIGELRMQISNNAIDDIDLTLQQLGMTSLLNPKKPTPLEEAQNLIYYLKYIYYDALGDLYSGIKHNLAGCSFDNPDLIKLGFWPGGDRDGNPNVTAATTIAVADDLRMSLMKCYYWDLKKLSLKLTFKQVKEILGDLKLKLYQATYDSGQIISYSEIMTALKLVREILVTSCHSLYLNDLNQFIDKVKIFRTHFAVLDIRQNHPVHKLTIQAILKKAGMIEASLEELAPAELQDLLIRKSLSIDANDHDDDLIKDAILTIQALKTIQTRNGEAGCCRYIVSNSEDIYSVLYVFALFRWCGCPEKVLTFDIIPLFESMQGMARARDIMEQLFSIPEYRQHIVSRGDRQTIMLGFSDGTKDGGYLQANWSIFKTKEALSQLCIEQGIKAIFFDGRGGPPARGGGKTHRFYAAQTEDIAKNEIQLTIQGQTITSRYGTKEHLAYNCEQLLSAGFTNRVFKRKIVISEEQRALIEELAKLSHIKYSALKAHPLFLPYLEQKSSLKYYAEANIGSRPDRRKSVGKLKFEDLRAIPFVGAWSQMKQNVPGYFGIGTALKKMVDAGREEELIKLFEQVPFFKTLMQNSMMSLFKCYFELTSYFLKDKTYAEFWEILHAEYQLSVDMTLLISGYAELMEDEPISRRSIDIRKRIVLPLLLVQQAALQQIENNSSTKASYEKMVVRSLYGNINASRNSA